MKNVLVVTYYWPPAGGVEVQRMVKFCKYLPKFGWNPIILTVNDGNYANTDTSYFDDIKDLKSIYRAKSLEPHSMFNALTKPLQKKNTSKNNNTSKANSSQSFVNKLGEYVRLNLFIPDSRIGWFPNAVKMGSKIIEEYQPELILSSSPPYTVHLIARYLKNKHKLPWVVDFRDPWLENTAYNTVPRLGVVKRINHHLECKTLAQADKITTVGKNMASLLNSKIGCPEKIEIITNGYDHTIPPINNKQSDTFYISHFGPIYWRRFPAAAVQAIKQLLHTSENFAANFKFRNLGAIDPQSLHCLQTELPKENLELKPYVDRSVLNNILAEPQLMLLSIEDIPHNKLIITGKIFDYITTGNPILGIGPVDGDAADIINKTNTGKMFDYANNEGIMNTILDAYYNWKEGKLQTSPQDYPDYKRENLAAKLANLMNKLP
ncbi:glycosyltransferase [Pseudomonadota bacterium]